MPLILAVDAGGTSTRAAVFDSSGRCLGFGRAGAGNPTSAGIDGAVGGIGTAVEAALRSVGGDHGGAGSSVAIALAGEETDAFHDAVTRRLGPLGFPGVSVVPDLLGMFHSGTSALDGYVLIAGTGAIAGRVVDGRLDRVAGGAGWLLGDAGSGFWIGHRVARAVVADLDGSAPSTVLTKRLLAELGVDDDPRLDRGTPRTLRRLVSVLYALRPVELARFAPLAFAEADDAVAHRILDQATSALESLLASVRDYDLDREAGRRTSLPVVVGGSVLINGMLAGRTAGMPFVSSGRPPLGDLDMIPVADGLVGAAVIAFRDAGLTIETPLFEQIRSTCDSRRYRRGS